MRTSIRLVLITWVALTLTTALVACGSDDGSSPTAGNTGTSSAQVSLTAPGLASTKTGTIGRNYLDMSAPWFDWSGAPSRAIYDDSTSELIIPAPTDNNDLVIGVQRYEMKLGSRRYSLNIESASADVAALIFVYDSSGQILPLNGQDGPFVARPGQPFHFDAPQEAVGYFVQVQGGWQASQPAAVRARLNDIGIVLGNNLIDPRGTWTTWDGVPAKVSFNALINRLVIQAPDAGEPVRYGVQRIASPLIAGQPYKLSVSDGSTAGASVLLFLIDARGGLIPFTDPETDTAQPWLAVTSQSVEPLVGAPSAAASAQFVAPSDVAEIAVQIQGAWNGEHGTVLVPALQAVTAP